VRTARYSIVVVFLSISSLAGCPDPDPEPVLPDLTGRYNLATQQRDSSCLPEVADPDQIFGFLEESAGGIPVIAMDVEQEGDSLVAVLDPSGCEWSGVVDVARAFSLSGPCGDAEVGRIGRIAANATGFGDTWEVDGTLTVEVDTQTLAGEPGPDGVTDCEVVLDLAGSGS